MEIKREVVFYKFNDTNQKTEIVKCDLEEAHDLYTEESIKFEKGVSDYTYFDITVNGKMLRSFKSQTN